MAANLFDLTGQVALVTGARRGIGQGIARTLAGAGADIVGLGPNPMPETEAIVLAAGRRFAAIRADLAEGPDFNALVEEAVAKFGRIDILANNSGTVRRGGVLDITEDDWDTVIEINLKSLFFLSQAVARYMIAAKIAGRIINTASLLSFQGGVRVAPYTVSKHGVAGVTRLMANELAPHGITVNAIAPGYIETDLTDALRSDPARARELLGRIPAGRWGRTDDLATAILFLASPASAYVTGTLVPIDGGWLAR